MAARRTGDCEDYFACALATLFDSFHQGYGRVVVKTALIFVNILRLSPPR